MRARMAVLLLALAPAAAGAQEVRVLPDLPRDVEQRLNEMHGDADALRLTGPVAIPADSVVSTRLVVEGGSLSLDGRVAGDVLVLAGDLLLGPGAAVDGDVLVVGGEIRGIEAATVSGTLLAFGQARALADGRDAPRRSDPKAGRGDAEDDDHEDDDRDRGDWSHRHGDDGGLDLGLSVAGNYNRVEGLPLMLGPVVETDGPNRLRISGQAVWRSEPSTSLEDEVGYHVRLDQGLFGDRLRVGGEAASLVQAIETRGLNSTEAGLAAALFHSDPHDYYQRRGWAVHVEARPRALPIEAGLRYRQAEHAPLELSDPWSLFRGDDGWRLQPVVARGDVSTLALSFAVDTRDDEDEPVRGVLASIGVERALEQDLAMPAVDFDGASGGGETFEDFTVARVDLRAHLPVNRSSTLNLRAFGAGAVEATALPPQFQQALGGIGTLPGFGLFDGACGSRDERVALVSVDTAGNSIPSGQRLRPAYGCDRVLLGQLEYRGGFGLGFGDGGRHRGDDHDHDWWPDWKDVDLEADWSFFVDVAQGWSFGDIGFAERADTETMADVGVGLLFDQAGVYAALPITGEDRSLRVLVRLQRRF